HGPTAASSTPGRTFRRYTARAGKPNAGRGHGASAENVRRQEALCSAQTDPGTGVRHHQIGARIPPVLAARARQGARRVEPRDHGMEHQADVHPQRRLMRPARVPAAKKSGNRAISTVGMPSSARRGSADGKIALGLQSQTSVRQAARDRFNPATKTQALSEYAQAISDYTRALDLKPELGLTVG